MAEPAVPISGVDHAEPETLPALLRRNARDRANRAAMRAKEHGIWQVWTWAQVLDETRAIAAGLAALGVERGATVAIIGDNRPRLYWSVGAAQALGAVPVPLFQEDSSAEIGAIIGRAGIDLAIAEDQEQVDKLLAARASTGGLRQIVYLNGRGLHGASEVGLISLQEMLQRGKAWLTNRPDALDHAIAGGKASDPSVILYTTGTTARPKGVMLSHANVIAAARDTIRFDRLDETDETLAFLPMAWVGDHLTSYVQPLVAGYCVSCPESGATLLADLREIGPTHLAAPPRVFEALSSDVAARMASAGRFRTRLYDRAIALARRVGGAILDGEPVSLSDRLRYRAADALIYGPLRNALGLSRLRRAYVVGDAIGPDILGFYRGLGLNLKQSYAITEASGLVCLQPDGGVRPDAAGVPLLNVELRIDRVGEIALRGAGVFIGYQSDPAATAAAMTADGWLRTGDIGVLDPDGQLRVIDRTADLGQRREGAVFAPKFIENKLKSSPFIKQAVAVGDASGGIACMLDIDVLAVGGWAERAGLVFASHQELASRPEVRDLLAGCVEAVNQDLAGQTIRRFLILPKSLDPDDGELTRMRGLRRTLVLTRYAALIEALNTDCDRVRLNLPIGLEDGRESVLEADLTIRTLVPARVAS